jgi:hypothetical protein
LRAEFSLIVREAHAISGEASCAKDPENFATGRQIGASELFDAPQVPVPLLLREGQEGGQIFTFAAGLHNAKWQNLINSPFNVYSHCAASP